MNLISQWNQSEFHSDLRLLLGQPGKLSKNDQKDSKSCVGLKTCEPDLTITNVGEDLKTKTINWIFHLDEALQNATVPRGLFQLNEKIKFIFLMPPFP